MSASQESTLQRKRMTISISQVAPLIGLDNYGNFPRIVSEIWRRFNPVEFREFELRLKSAGHALANSSEMNDIWEVDDLLGTNILEQVRLLNSNTGKSSADMTKSQSVISDYIANQTKISDDKKAEIIKKVCSITNKSHGVSNEDAILDEFCKLSGKTLQGTQGWVEIPLAPFIPATNYTSAGAAGVGAGVGDRIEIEWVVIGKYDALTTDGELVEAKMRQKGLFKSMRDYENVQVQLYMRAQGCTNGFLVEGFSKNTKGTSTKKGNAKSELVLYTHEIAYDASYVEEIILARLATFTKYFQELMLDTKRKEKLLQSDKSEWNKYLEDYLEIPTIDF